jgi:Ca2+-binding RTX toxin-like protein
VVSTDNGEDAFPGLYCGTTSDNAIDIEGNGGDDTIEPASGNFADANVHPLTSVLIDGGAGNDTISTFPTVTTPGASLTFNGGDGNDTINAMDVSCPAANPPTLAISGDAGDDILTGSAFGCNSVIHGGDGNDTINGNSGTDQLFGDAGNDSITGGSGAVTMDGGPGTDSLSAGNDVLHPTNDTFDAVDGERDTITCGFGADIANIDQFDIVPSPASPNACEQVNVTQVGGTTPTPTPSPPCRCVLPPTTKLAVTVPATHSEHVLKTHVLAVKVDCSVACIAGAGALLTIGGKPKHGLKTKTATVTLAKGGSGTVKLRLSSSLLKQIKSGLHHHKHVLATVVLAVSPIAAGAKPQQRTEHVKITG